MVTEKLLQTTSGLTELCKLAEYYGTDKAGWYSPFYDLLFRDRRDKVYKVLEIGVGTVRAMSHVKGYKAGASLKMWRDYFPNAEIFGIDNDSAALDAPLGGRIKVFHCDQSSEAQLNEVCFSIAPGGKFDLIIDDGSHKPEDQLLTFKILSPWLDSRGLYVIEDANADFFLLDDKLPEHTTVQHYHGEIYGRAILIRGEVL